MKKAIHLKFGYNKKNLILESDYFFKDNDIINNIYPLLYKRLSFNIAGKGLLGTSINIYGKEIESEILINKEKVRLKAIIGTLNSNKHLIKYIEASRFETVTRMYFNEKEIDMECEKSLLSLGIKSNFNCQVETIPKREN